MDTASKSKTLASELVIAELRSRQSAPWYLAPGALTRAIPRRASMVIAAGDGHQVGKFFGVLDPVGLVPTVDQPHRARHDRTEQPDGHKGRQTELGHAGIEGPQSQDAGLFVEVLNRDGATRAHQVGAAVL